MKPLIFFGAFCHFVIQCIAQDSALFYTQVPAHDYDIILACPSNHSVTISLLPHTDAEYYIVYSKENSQEIITEKIVANKYKPEEIILKNLENNTKYNYWVYFKKNADAEFKKSKQMFFNTSRSQHDDFFFTITADPHLDQNCDTSILTVTMSNIAGDSADFHIDMGDIFMVDKYKANYQASLDQYLAIRYYYGLFSHSSPLYIVLGNHDGEAGSRLNGTENNMAVWSNLTRKKYFPNPVPDNFYSGNLIEEKFVGLPQNYYSWQWGNSLFIVLDPFWFTTRQGNNDAWKRTLGKQQYDWLNNTLANSRATFKFVFIHNLVGGFDKKGKARGGKEAAPYYEWGGLNSDSTSGFSQNRPGWEMPVHQLLVKNNVDIVFHGHDHFFAKQELDSIIYQCLPQPGANVKGNTKHAVEYGYNTGTFLNAPGYLRAKVSQSFAEIEYVVTDKNNPTKNKEVLFYYRISK